MGSTGDYPTLDFNGLGAPLNSTGNYWTPYLGGSTPFGDYNSNYVTYNGTNGGANQQSQIFGLSSLNLGGGTNNVNGQVDGYKTGLQLDANRQTEIGNQLYIGNSGGLLELPWNGLVGEIIIFDRELSTAEQLKVNSYLAIKYGITLDQRQANDYTASDGTVTYAASTFGAYDHDIAGIGIDSCAGLIQPKSTSVNEDAVVTIEANTTNISNLEFLVWANNDSSLAPSETNNIPSGLPFSCPSRLERIWHVQETGDVGNVTLDFNISDISFITSAGFRLLIKNGNDDMSTASISSIIPTIIGDSIVRFTNVDLANNDYFTLAGNILAPGGVNNNLVAWYKSDDAASDVALSGTTVTQWNDIYGGKNLTRYSSVGTPTYRTSGTKLINYNNSVEFDNDAGNYQFFQNTSRYFPNTSGFHMITVGKDLENNTPYGVLRATAGMGDNGNYPGLDLESDVTHGWNFVMAGSSPTDYYTQGGTQSGYPLLYNGYTAGTNQQPQIYSVGSLNNVTTVGAANNIYSYIDGFKWLTDMDAYQQTPIGNHLYVGSSGGDAFWDGLIGEVLIYDGLLSDEEILRVNTYLAIKYGITLNQSQYNDYTASNGTVVYAASAFGAYDHDIFGIGEDSCSGLIQKQSKSVNKGFQPAVSLNNGLATSNTNNTNSFVENYSFWLTGHNGQDTTFTDVYTAQNISITNCLKIMDRVWHVQESGTIGNVTITIPQLSASTATSTYLVVGNTDAFGTGTTEILMVSDGSGNLTAQHNFTTGQYFSFVVPYATIDTSTIKDSICANTSITFNNQTLTGSGIYLDTLTSIRTGCDSIVKLILTVLPLDSHTIVRSICKGDSIRIGTKVYKISGTYTDTLKNANRFGCDSIIKLNLTVNDIDTGNVITSICKGQSYTFNGQSIKGSGIYLDTITSLVTSCDSIIKLILTVNDIDTGNVIATICQGQSYTFNGQSITGSGIYLDTITSLVTSCDSIIRLTLTVNNIDTGNVIATICQGQSYTFNGQSLTTDGIYLDTITSLVTSCDSIIRLTLTVNDIDTGNITAAICQGQSYTFNGQSLTVSNTYLDTITSLVTSCDSIVRLTLTVNTIDTSNISASICTGKTYTFNGQALAVSGTYLDTLTSTVTSCDSIIRLYLTVDDAITINDSKSICIGDSVKSCSGRVYKISGTYLDTCKSADGCDSITTLVLKVNDIDTGNVIASICKGQSYTFNGQSLTGSGIYLDTITSLVTSCDSIIKLILTVNDIDTGNVIATICQGQSYTFNGQSLIGSGIYLDTITSLVTSCDSIVRLTLTVNDIDTGNITAAICQGQSYTFNGQSLTVSNTYLDTITSLVTSCDSIVRLTLTVNTIDTSNISASICTGKTYTFNGQALAVSGTYLDTITSLVTSCDSIVRLFLTVNTIDTSNISASICTGQTYTFNGQALAASGTYLDTLTSTVTSCDSIVRLYLTVDDAITINASKSICIGDSVKSCSGRVYKISGTYLDTCKSAEGCDSITTLVLTVHDIDTGNVIAAICQGQSYTFNGQSLTGSGIYLDTITSLVTSCDSIIRLTLTVNDIDTGNITASICQGQSYTFNGQSLTGSGIYLDTITSLVTSCDSIIRLTLTVNTIDTGRVSASICQGQSYTFNGQSLTGSGIYLDTITSLVTSCDSIIRLTLTVNDVDTGNITASICQGQSYTFNGQSLTVSNTYLDTITSLVTSCDSIVRLTLTVNDIDTGNVIATICQGQSYTFNGQSITGSGIYLDTITSLVTSCDSIIRLTLTVNDIDTGNITAAICQGQSYTFNGQSLTVSNTYLDTITSLVTSCDSIVRLTLTVNTIDTSNISASICTGKTYTFNGQALAVSGTYLDTLTSTVTSCDSIIRLYLTVDDAITINVSKSICIGDSVKSCSGRVYKISGTYLDTCKSADGCDSITTLVLKVNDIDTGNVIASICKGQSYTFNGQSLTGSGIYLDTITSLVTSCDSIVRLTLTVNDIDTGNVIATICQGQSYTFNGQSLTIEGTYLDTITSTVTSCDSIVRLTLTVNDIDTGNVIATICQGQSYTFNGQSITGSGIYLDTITSLVTSCDSIIRLTLTVNDIDTGNITNAICQGQSYTFNGQSLTVSNTYLDTITSLVTSCDSIVRLTLTVNTIDTSNISASICTGKTYTFNGQALAVSGTYLDTLTSTVTSCDSIIRLYLTVDDVIRRTINTTICYGDSIISCSGRVYKTAGTYTDTCMTLGGCDSITTTIIVLEICSKDTVPVLPVCDTCTETICLDTIFDITNGVWTLCDGTQNATTGFGSYSIDNTTGCITYTASGTIGRDTLCIVVCNATQTVCDTQTVVVKITPTTVIITDTIPIGATDSICIPLETGMNPDDIIIYECAEALDNISLSYYTINNGCVMITYVGENIGSDEFCVVVCDKILDVCDTTKVIIVVEPKDTVTVLPVCDTCTETLCLDTIFDITNGVWTLCDGTQNATTGFGSYSIDNTTGCITYTASGTIGRDTLCIVVCNATQTVCDTQTVVVKITPSIEVISDTIKIGATDSICVPIETGMNPDNITLLECNGELDNISIPFNSVNVHDGCVMVTYIGTSIGSDEFCVVVCDSILDICDTTRVIIVVIPDDTLPVFPVCDTCTETLCLDTIYNITNGYWTLCDGSQSATSGLGSYNIDSTTGCITYTANGIIGRDTICIIVCDSTKTVCDTVPIIIDVVCSQSNEINIDTTICSNKPIVINGQTISISGTYTIHYTAHNTCDSTVILRVTAVDCNCIIAKGFSPNGDGINDNYDVDCLIKESIDGKINFSVYNRWGIEVYRNDTYDGSFNGNYKGEPLPDGTYYFVLEYTNKLNEEIKVASYLTIQR
ncbi:MAG: gliding motility-associated C-terminal domain-containing protein [Sphingobacteriales bacterium]|nr:MAG: gliding motility-associated C-terminal domain-containing protein [Sphingobacteriales bacterium]